MQAKNKAELDAEQWSQINNLATELGFLEIAAAPVAAVKDEAAVREWVSRGYHADMAWYARGLDKRLNLDLILPGAASVIVLTTPYHKEACFLAGRKLARYACGDDYHEVLKKKLWVLIEAMRTRVPDTGFRPYVDTGPILERYWAREAGLGWIGKNGNLISRHAGSYLFLACIVTDLIVPYGQPHAPFCGECRACIDSCPTDAIPTPGTVDANKCISYLNIEHRGPFQEAPAFDGWIFGCDICQEVCPWVRKFSRRELMPELRPRSACAQLSDKKLAGMEQEEFSTLFSKSAIKRTKLAGLKRNLNHLRDKGE